MSKRISIVIDFDESMSWEDCYRRTREIMDLADATGLIEGWESCDGEWFNEWGEELTPEHIVEIRKAVNES